jgi:pyridoxal 5'-phosphate synthase pdxS subunit
VVVTPLLRAVQVAHVRRTDAGTPRLGEWLPSDLDDDEITGALRRLASLDDMELATEAKELQAPLDLVRSVAATGRLPVPLFCAGGIATPADAALVMQLGAEAVFVGSGIFKSAEPEVRAKAIVEATAHYNDPHIVAKVSRGLGDAMRGEQADSVEVRLAERGW